MTARFRLRPWPLAAAVLLAVAAGHVYPQWVEDSISVPGSWVGSLAYNSREDVLYGLCEQAGMYFAIDCSSNQVVASVPLRKPREVAYDSTDNKLYLPFQEVGYESLAVIDGYSHAVVKKLDLPDANLAVWDTVSGRLYISRCYSNCVSVLDCRADTFVAHIAVGAAPLKMYINTLRRKLYVLNYDAGTVSVIDLATNQVIKTIDVGTVPNAGYYCRRMDKFYCPGEYGEVVAIDGRTDSIVARIPIRQNSLILSLAGNDAIPVVMVGVYDGGSYVYTVNAALDSVTASLSVPGEPYGLLYSPASDRLYCPDDGRGSVTIVSGDGTRILKTLPLGDDPYVLLRVPRHDRIYVGDLGRAWVYVIKDSPGGIEEDPENRPLAPALRISPSPFTRMVTAMLANGGAESAPVRVFSLEGRLVGTFGAWQAEAGRARAVWDGLGLDGKPVPRGVYIASAADSGCRVKLVRSE